VTRALLALGSNLGDRVSHLREAIEAMPDVAEVSPVYETDPIGGPDEQGAYLNLVVRLDTQRSPRDLLELCRSLEEAANRVRRERWGPRTLDVDVLWVDGHDVQEPDLVVPHPRMFERPFVLAPLSHVAPDLAPEGWETRFDELGVHLCGELAELPPEPVPE
jgi:2-amino-4-hydroxy-6-hydroxymethyldihydropteridine diphosphokinase